MAPSGRVLACGIYRHPIGFEVRAGYADTDVPVHTHVKRTMDLARELATAWLAAVKEKGSCEELPSS